MTNTKTIEISITLNAFIEQNRKNFSEDANDILCRLLGIAQPPPSRYLIKKIFQIKKKLKAGQAKV